MTFCQCVPTWFPLVLNCLMCLSCIYMIINSTKRTLENCHTFVDCHQPPAICHTLPATDKWFAAVMPIPRYSNIITCQYILFSKIFWFEFWNTGAAKKKWSLGQKFSSRIMISEKNSFEKQIPCCHPVQKFSTKNISTFIRVDWG